MRCESARELIIESAGDPALAAHVEECGACRAEQAQVQRLHAALRSLDTEASVHAGIEARTMGRVHEIIEREDRARARWRLLWQWLPIPVVAVLAAAVGLSWSLRRGGDEPVTVAEAASEVAPELEPERAPVEPTRVASSPSAPASPQAAEAAPVRVADAAAQELPPGLVDELELYLALPILQNMEKLQNYETIQTTTVSEDYLEGSSG